jgi:hypothetical protein
MKEYHNHFRPSEYPVGMAYVPWQYLDKTYETLEEAFHEGTLFPELNKPFCGRRCEK